MSPSLTLYAGPTALKSIQENGINADLFEVFAGAAGGPKWFTLHGLDQYLFEDFLPQKKQPLYTIGSSAGAWRISCLAQKQPKKAIDRLAEKYSIESYTEKPDAAEISAGARVMLDYVIGENGASEVINNPNIQTHLVTNRCKALLSSEQPLLQMMGLATSAFANLISRSTLQYFFERVVFHSNLNSSGHFKLDSFDTTQVALAENNFKQVLLASGSIPVVLEGIKDIPGAPAGMYRDGGVTDYHFDFQFTQNDKLVLYPHFSRTVLPGWFDKHVPWRDITASNYDNVLLLVPSAEHVAKLPYGKISDRKDFQVLDDESRIRYWKTVISESQRLGDEFQEMAEGRLNIESIQPLFP
jgi:hypothetical protein